MIIKHGDKIHPAIFLQNQRRIPRSATNSEGHIINLFRIKEILFLRLWPGNGALISLHHNSASRICKLNQKCTNMVQFTLFPLSLSE